MSEHLAVAGGDTEQLADHGDGELEGEVVDDVEVARVAQRRQQLLGQHGDSGAEPFHRARSERLADEAADAGVIRRVHEQQDPGQHVAGDVGDAAISPQTDEAGRIAVVAAPAGLAKDRLHRGVRRRD